MRKKFNYFPKVGTSLRYVFLKGIVSTLLTSCALAPTTVVHDAVGPDLVRQQENNGFLTVYSATAWMTDTDGPSLLHHTDYEIDAIDGTSVQTVRNGDEAEPARVPLTEGKYVVEAESDSAGTVKVPVAIKAGRTTTLHLEREKDWKAPPVQNGNLVRLPNGQPIGVRAQTGGLPKAG